MKRIAYIRASTEGQCVDRQIDGLGSICDELHTEKLSALSQSRPVYDEVMAKLRSGDVFVIWDLDRAYRDTRDALDELDRLHARGISIHIANLSVDTSTPYGKLIYTIISALAEFERGVLSQRTREGIAAARRRGKRIGRPPKLTEAQLSDANIRVSQHKESYTQIAAEYGVSSWTLSRSLSKFRENSQI